MTLFESWDKAVESAVKKHQPKDSILFDEEDRTVPGPVHVLRLKFGDKISEPLRVCRTEILVHENPNELVAEIFRELWKRMPNG